MHDTELEMGTNTQHSLVCVLWQQLRALEETVSPVNEETVHLFCMVESASDLVKPLLVIAAVAEKLL